MSHDVQHETGLLLTSEESDLSGRPLLTFTLRPIYFTTDGDIRNYVGGGFSSENALADLIITAQLDHVASSGEPYGWRVEYRDVYSLDLDRAETAVKTLRKVRRALERADAREGYAETFAAYVLRVARALGVARFGWARVSTGTYATGDYQWTDASGITSEIRSRVSAFNTDRASA